MGDYAKALASFQQSLAIAQQIKNRRELAKVLLNLGGTYYFLGDYPKAIQFYEQAWNISWNYINDARLLYAIRGNEGLAYFQMGNFPRAIEFYQQYFKLTSAYSERRGEGVARNNLALAQLQSGNITEAEKNLLEGIKIWESLRARLDSNDAYKISIFETQNAIYSNLQKILVFQNKLEAALEIAERGRARAFVELLARRLSPKPTSNTIAAPTIEQIKQIAKTQNATLVEYSIINENFILQEKLQTQESELYIWVIKPTGEIAFKRSDLKPLWQQQNSSTQNLVINTRESIGVRGRGITVLERVDETTPSQRVQQLYQLLIQPIAELLPTASDLRVIFIPQGQLFLVPFAALQDAMGKYLIEKHTILTAPSIQVLDLSLFCHSPRIRIKK